jgi:putative effector of murein hydrolase LrgA (UPF0299 family)
MVSHNIGLKEFTLILLYLAVMVTFLTVYQVIKDQTWWYLGVIAVVTFVVMWYYIYSVYLKHGSYP